MSGIAWANIFNDAKNAPSFDPLPEGAYNLQVEESELKKTQNKGETMFSYKARVLDGPHAKRTVYGNVIVPGANAENAAQRAGFFMRDLGNLGITPEFLATQPTEEALNQAFVGCIFRGKITQYQGNDGETRNRIDRIMQRPKGPTGAPAPGGAPAPAAPPMQANQPFGAAPAAPAAQTPPPAPAPAPAPQPAAAPPAPPAPPAAPAAAPAAPPQVDPAAAVPPAPAPAPAAAPPAPPAAAPQEIPTLPDSPFST